MNICTDWIDQAAVELCCAIPDGTDQKAAQMRQSIVE